MNNVTTASEVVLLYNKYNIEPQLSEKPWYSVIACHKPHGLHAVPNVYAAILVSLPRILCTCAVSL